MPDPFAAMPELQEWRLFALFLMRLGKANEGACQYVQWLQRTGWCSPSEWHSEEGDRLRKAWVCARCRPRPKPNGTPSWQRIWRVRRKILTTKCAASPRPKTRHRAPARSTAAGDKDYLSQTDERTRYVTALIVEKML